MSNLGGANMELKEVEDAPSSKPQMAEGKIPPEVNSVEALKGSTEEDEEEAISSAHLEPATLPWPGERDRKFPLDEDRDTVISAGSLSEERSQAEGDNGSRERWRESMPEGERWRDDDEVLVPKDKGDGSLADDEEEDEGDEDQMLKSKKAAAGFTANVQILRPSSKEPPDEGHRYREETATTEAGFHLEPESAPQFYSQWEEQDDKYYICEEMCSEKLRLSLAVLAGAFLFPLLVWGGYALLPFDPPQLRSAPLRVLYTLRCSFFAIIPILLGVVVKGFARLRYSALRPLYHAEMVNKDVIIHWHYVNESLSLFLFYFLQLAVMATYISQDLVKLIPLLTIIFVFGRLIYWLCLSLDSTIRGFGFSFSFFPILVMLGVNLYYVCSSVGQGSVFDVAPPATDPPPRMRWW